MTKAAVININMDAKCVRCGCEGRTESGYCLACAAKMINEMLISTKALEEIQGQVSDLFQTYERKINQAAKGNGNQISVTFKADLQIYANGQVGVQTEIAFTTEKIKDKSEVSMMSEIQGDMFEGEG